MGEPTPTNYHAHVYYPDAVARREAEALREAVDAEFSCELGRWRDQPVGPHPIAMFQIKFEVDTFATLVPWLQFHHGSLSVLIHPSTGDHLADHTRYALWLGPQLALRTEVFSSD